MGGSLGIVPCVLWQKLLHGPRAADFCAAPGWSHFLVQQRKAKQDRRGGASECAWDPKINCQKEQIEYLRRKKKGNLIWEI